MRLVDLSHPWNMHTPGWVGYPGSKIYYTQTLQTNRIVSQRVVIAAECPSARSFSIASARPRECGT